MGGMGLNLWPGGLGNLARDGRGGIPCVARPNPLTLGVFVLYFGSLWLTESFMERSLGVSLVAMAWMWGVVPKKEN